MPELTERLQHVLGGGYRIRDELGAGGMSRVFIAEETELGRDIVVKVLPPELEAEVNIDRFRREIQTAARLQHPHLVPVLSAGSREGILFYTMPRIEGESLRSRLKRCGQLPIGEAVRFLRDIADALEYAHAHGVIHRDIKPENILVSGHHAFVTDFGVAKALSVATGEPNLTSAGVALGTPAYMSPEQASADPTIDQRTDIYALGAVGYEMLTGCPPFAGSTQQILAAHITRVPPPIVRHRADAPAALCDLIMRCLMKDPADRVQSAEEVHQQLELAETVSTDARAGREPAAPSSRRAEKTRKPRDDEIESYGLTHRGLVRTENHDHFLIGRLRKRVDIRQSSLADISQIPLTEERMASFIMVADGLAGGLRGGQASRIALEVATRYVAESASCYVRVVEEQIDLGQALEEGAKRCHRAIQERAAADPAAAGMASTLTLFISVWPWIYLIHAGNSRYYVYYEGKLTQISRDQGNPPGDHLAPVVSRIPSRWSSIHLLCTDGLTKHVSDERIAQRLSSIQSARQVCEDLVEDALDGGGTDNITVAIGRVVDRD